MTGFVFYIIFACVFCVCIGLAMGEDQPAMAVICLVIGVAFAYGVYNSLDDRFSKSFKISDKEKIELKSTHIENGDTIKSYTIIPKE